MSHIFAGCSIAGLSRAPFEPAYTGSLRTSARDIGLDISEDACLLFVPAIGGYVGGDVTAGLLSSGVKMTDALTLYIDFGTNGEIVLIGNGAAYACSAAAGPAFGRAGLLGSGMIDAVADMLGSDIIDETGKFVCGIERCSCEAACNSNEKKRCYSEITQKHIRDFQLAKGAVAAGTEILLKKAGKNAVDIERAVLSGVFGSSINPKSALDVKLLPQIASELIEFAGNLAGDGASEILIEPRKLKEAEKIAGRIEHIELADEADFQELFVCGLNF